jgi:3-phosphoshikimate 1-carboxyvinyltransferase
VKVERGFLKPFTFDATDCPDLFPPLVTLACGCEGTSLIKGVERLIFKESNRAMALEKEFSFLGADIKIENNCMMITGGKLKGGEVDSHGDHRLAMALAISSIITEGNVIMSNSDCVSKSYPNFFEDFISLGGNVDEWIW